VTPEHEHSAKKPVVIIQNGIPFNLVDDVPEIAFKSIVSETSGYLQLLQVVEVLFVLLNVPLDLGNLCRAKIFF